MEKRQMRTLLGTRLVSHFGRSAGSVVQVQHALGQGSPGGTVAVGYPYCNLGKGVRGRKYNTEVIIPRT